MNSWRCNGSSEESGLERFLGCLLREEAGDPQRCRTVGDQYLRCGEILLREREPALSRCWLVRRRRAHTPPRRAGPARTPLCLASPSCAQGQRRS